MRNSSKTALGGMIAALSVTIMLLTSVITSLQFALPAMAGALLILIVIEINKGWATCTYVTVSILSFLILPNKEAAMVYFAFFGCYPIIKPILERNIKINALCYFLKFMFFNATAIGAYAVIIYVMGIPIEGMEKFGAYAIPALLLLANIMFISYDICLTRLVTLYLNKWQRKFRKLFKH